MVTGQVSGQKWRERHREYKREMLRRYRETHREEMAACTRKLRLEREWRYLENLSIVRDDPESMIYTK